MVRLYRPFAAVAFVAALPPTVAPSPCSIAPRSRAPSASRSTWTWSRRWSRPARGATSPAVIGGRYGLSSKEFTPAMARRSSTTWRRPTPRNHFTIGIVDDVTQSSLHWDRDFGTEPETW